jgi:hypothetical protein
LDGGQEIEDVWPLELVDVPAQVGEPVPLAVADADEFELLPPDDV